MTEEERDDARHSMESLRRELEWMLGKHPEPYDTKLRIMHEDLCEMIEHAERGLGQ